MPIVRKILIGKVEDMKEGACRMFKFGFKSGLLFNDGGVLRAYENFCTHMGGLVEPCGNVLRCRWHKAEFDPASGERLSGEAPEGSRLKPIELIVEGGQVFAKLELIDPFE